MNAIERIAEQRILLVKLAAMRGGSRDARIEAAYYDRLATKFRKPGLEGQAQNRPKTAEDDRT